MVSTDKLVVVIALVVLFGLSYVFAIAAFAGEYLFPATGLYVICAIILVWRIVRAPESG